MSAYKNVTLQESKRKQPEDDRILPKEADILQQDVVSLQQDVDILLQNVDIFEQSKDKEKEKRIMRVCENAHEREQWNQWKSELLANNAF